MMETVARHPVGEKAAAGGGQESRYTRYQAVNGVSTANDIVAPPTTVGDTQQRFLEMPGKGSERFSLKTEPVTELESKIHAQVSEKIIKRKKATAAGKSASQSTAKPTTATDRPHALPSAEGKEGWTSTAASPASSAQAYSRPPAGTALLACAGRRCALQKPPPALPKGRSNGLGNGRPPPPTASRPTAPRGRRAGRGRWEEGGREEGARAR